MDHFREPSGKGPGAVFGGFWDPKWSGLGAQKWAKNEVGSKRGNFQKTLQKPMNFQYFNGLRGLDFHSKLVPNPIKFWVGFGPP